MMPCYKNCVSKWGGCKTWATYSSRETKAKKETEQKWKGKKSKVTNCQDEKLGNTRLRENIQKSHAMINNDLNDFRNNDIRRNDIYNNYDANNSIGWSTNKFQNNIHRNNYWCKLMK